MRIAYNTAIIVCVLIFRQPKIISMKHIFQFIRSKRGIGKMLNIGIRKQPIYKSMLTKQRINIMHLEP